MAGQLDGKALHFKAEDFACDEHLALAQRLKIGNYNCVQPLGRRFVGPRQTHHT